MATSVGLLGLMLLVSIATCSRGDNAPDAARPQQAGDVQPARPQPPAADEDKRAWQDLNGGWGKRGWQDLQAGWGKRAWDDLRPMWGKRYLYPESADDVDEGDDADLPPLVAASIADDEDDQGSEEKRAWRSLGGAWGKRSADWANFRGSWGKREPGWNNLKGLWGKRESKWARLSPVWGKRSAWGMKEEPGASSNEE